MAHKILYKEEDHISFDLLESLFEKTRPFIKSNEKLKTFEYIIEKIECFNSKPIVRIFDAGTGTGRLIIPFIKQFSLYLGSEKNKFKNNVFEFYCLDISNIMLQKLGERIVNKDCGFIKISENEYSKTISGFEIKIFLITEDLRIYKPDNQMDIIFAHWIFHTIKDWQIALLNIFDFSKDSSLLFTFEEISDLYYAIDNNLGMLRHDKAKKFWSEYFRIRKKVYKYYGIAMTPPRHRIGANVADKQVAEYLKLLHYEFENYDEYDEWDSNFDYEFIINTVIKERAFSNMRLENNNEKVYEEIAETLKKTGSIPHRSGNDWKINDTFNSLTKFSVRCYTKNNNVNLSEFIQILTDALKKKTPNDLFTIPIRVFDKFFETLVHKFSQVPTQEDCYNNSDREVIKEIIGISFNHTKDNFKLVDIEDRVILRSFNESLLSDQEARKTWINLHKYSDFDDDCYVINFDGVTEDNYCCISIDDSMYAMITNKKKKVTDADFEDIFLNLQKNRLILTENNLKSFFNAVTALYKLKDKGITHIYIFPKLAYIPSGISKTFGFMFLCTNKLNSKFIDELKKTNETIWSDLSNDFKTDFHINKSVVVTSHRDETKHSLKNMQDNNLCCDVLIATCTAHEFEQALKLAGVKKNEKEQRRLTQLTHTTAHPVFLYDISNANFKNANVWLFQCLETGGSELNGINHGVAYSIINVLDTFTHNKISNPKIIIMGGVAAGLQEDNQIKGHILVANAVQHISVENENVKSIGKIECPCCEVINDALKSEYYESIKLYKTLYQQKITNNLTLTVDKVVDDYLLRTKIKDKFPNAIGLEMEGYGLATVCNQHDIKWLLIKGISDFAHHKDEIEDYQKNVAKNTFDFIYFCLENHEF